MIGNCDFQMLRLGMYVQPVGGLDKRVFMGRTWVGDVVGASELLRLEDDPDRLGSLSADLNGLQIEVVG